MLSTPLRRSLAGLAVAAGLLPSLLALLACIPFPVGDPETSQIDPGLTGAWVGQDEDSIELLILRPYDRRTWLGTILLVIPAPADAGQPAPAGAEQATSPDALLARMLDERSDPASLDIHKIWLTTLGGRRFLCWERLHSVDDEKGEFRPPYWLVMRVDTPQPEAMELRFPADQRPWSEVKSSAEAEKVLRDNADRDTFYDETWRYARVPPSAYAQVALILKRFGLNQN